MKYFRVLVLGEHFKLNWAGTICYKGFYVTRYVAEETAEEASIAAIAAVQAEDKLEGLILNSEDDPPRLLVDELEEVSEADFPAAQPGYVFFEDESQSPTDCLYPN
ncbi:MAG: hypothetical protein ACK553_00525 [Planctomycetota bacterium]|jgi:hypothetical protein